MRIVHYTRTCYLDHSLSLVHAISQAHEVHLLLEISPEGLIGCMFGEATLRAEAAGVHSADGAIRRGFLAGAGALLTNLASFSLVVHPHPRAFAPDSVRTAIAAAQHIRQLRPDVLHVEDGSTRAIPIVWFTPRIPKLLAIHDAEPHLGERPGRRPVVQRLLLSQVDNLLFYSRYSQDLFTRRTGWRRSSFVPLGTKEVFRGWPGHDSPEQPATLLFFGRIARYKGLDVLYRALPEIGRRAPRLRVVVAGRPSPDYVLPRPPELPVNVELVTRFETVDICTLRRLFQEATVVVLPYLQASQSGVAQTAYAFYKPVVASAVGGLTEIVADGVTGRLVPPGQPERLADAVIELLLNESLRVSMHQAIRRREESELGWGPIARQLTHVYGETMAGS